MPQIIPPISWLRTVRVLISRPAAKAPTIRGTRISQGEAWTRTSTNSAPIAYITLSPWEPPLEVFLPAVEVRHCFGLEAARDELGILLDRAHAHALEDVFKPLLSAIRPLDLAVVQRQWRRIAPGEWTLV